MRPATWRAASRADAGRRRPPFDLHVAGLHKNAAERAPRPPPAPWPPAVPSTPSPPGLAGVRAGARPLAGARRFVRDGAERPTLVDDSYNAYRISLRAAIETSSPRFRGRAGSCSARWPRSATRVRPSTREVGAFRRPSAASSISGRRGRRAPARSAPGSPVRDASPSCRDPHPPRSTDAPAFASVLVKGSRGRCAWNGWWQALTEHRGGGAHAS